MAIFDVQLNTISRSDGRSATAAAAYRAGLRVVDERTGEVHDYRRKAGVESVSVVMPSACTWLPSPAELWNAAEHAEKRKNSTVARELVVALPHELEPAQRQQLVEQMSRAIAGRYSVAVMPAIHAPSAAGDERNHHAHLLFTTRAVSESGLGEKTRVLDDRKTGADETKWLRQEWERQANAALADAGVDARISGAKRSDDLPRCVHLGPAVTALERSGVRTEAGDANRTVIDARARFAAAREALPQLEREIDKTRASIASLERARAELVERQRAEADARARADAERQALGRAHAAKQLPRAEALAQDRERDLEQYIAGRTVFGRLTAATFGDKRETALRDELSKAQRVAEQVREIAEGRARAPESVIAAAEVELGLADVVSLSRSVGAGRGAQAQRDPSHRRQAQADPARARTAATAKADPRRAPSAAVARQGTASESDEAASAPASADPGRPRPPPRPR